MDPGGASLQGLHDSGERKDDSIAEPPPLAAVQALDANRPTEENAANLELGPEFRADEDAQPIFLAEAAHLLDMQMTSKAEQNITEVPPILKKSLEYAQSFNQLTHADHAINVRAQLNQVRPPLHPFEIAQLATLIPREPEEAKAIIPSLKERYDDNQLSDIIAGIENLL